MRVTFSRYKETGLAAVARAGNEDYVVKVDGEEVGSISKTRGKKKYYWYQQVEILTAKN